MQLSGVIFIFAVFNNEGRSTLRQQVLIGLKPGIILTQDFLLFFFQISKESDFLFKKKLSINVFIRLIKSNMLVDVENWTLPSYLSYVGQHQQVYATLLDLMIFRLNASSKTKFSVVVRPFSLLEVN